MKVRNLFALSTALMLSALPAHAAADYLLALDGIPGESTDENYPRTIEIESFSLGVTMTSGTVVGGGGGAGKASFSDISFSKKLDKSSPLLYLNCAQGKHIPQAILHVRKSGDKPQEYYTITLTDVLISSVQTSGASGTDRPSESLSLNFTKIEFSYAAQRPDGSLETPVTSSWNLATNTAE